MREFSEQNFASQWIPVSDLQVVWQEAQRARDERHVAQIVNDFDPDFFGTVTIAHLPDGSYHVVDGQHRVEAVRKIFGDKERVPCVVVRAATKKRAAEIWAAINGNRSKPSPVGRFLVDVTAGKAAETEISKTVNSLGYRISTSPSVGNIRAVSALVAVHRQHGIDVVRGSLALIQQTWGMDITATEASIIRGMAALLAEHATDINQQRFAKTLAKKYTPLRLIGSAKAAREMFGGNTAEAVKRLLIEAYNSGLASGRLERKAA